MRTLRRIAAGIFGGLLLGAALYTGWNASVSIYADYYWIPLQKYGVLTKPRWQDLVFYCGFYVLDLALLYVSYRLLKFACKAKASRQVPSTSP